MQLTLTCFLISRRVGAFQFVDWGHDCLIAEVCFSFWIELHYSLCRNDEIFFFFLFLSFSFFFLFLIFYLLLLFSYFFLSHCIENLLKALEEDLQIDVQDDQNDDKTIYILQEVWSIAFVIYFLLTDRSQVLKLYGRLLAQLMHWSNWMTSTRKFIMNRTWRCTAGPVNVKEEVVRLNTRIKMYFSPGIKKKTANISIFFP
jgi:hypothetical protein